MVVTTGSKFHTQGRVISPHSASMHASKPFAALGVIVKKGIIALLVVLALIVLVSPGIVGMLAEKSVDEQLEWARVENQDLVITTEHFNRGWFSSAGRHRIELANAANAPGLGNLLGFAGSDSLPALIIDTELNHGLIDLSSLTGENVSLVPGLGNAVSTLSIETADGELIELPGTVYSSLALTRDLQSKFRAEAGARDIVTWGDININFESIMSNGDYAYDGLIESLQIAEQDSVVELSNLSFSGDLAMSEFDFAVGDMRISLDALSVASGLAAPTSIGPLIFDTTSSVDGGRVNSSSELRLTVDNVPNVGQVELDTKLSIDGVDGAALKQLVHGLQAVQTSADPVAAISAVETEFLAVLAAGADLRIERLDVALPMGTIKSVMNIKILESDSADFGWASLLLALEADAQFEIPEMIADMAMMLSPQAGAVEGFLRKNGDVYELEAAYKKGLLTVNGVPLPIPIP